MTNISYAKPQIMLSSHHQMYVDRQDQLKEQLKSAILKRNSNSSGYNLDQFTVTQLEALLEYGSPHAYYTTQYSEDRSFIEDNMGRVSMACEPLADRNFRDWHDTHVMKKVSGYRKYKRLVQTFNDKTPEQRKADKIHNILDTIDDQYNKVISIIRNRDMDPLVNLTINRYESTIRKYIAGLLRIRAIDEGIYLSITESCDLLDVERSGMLSILEDLDNHGFYDNAQLVQDFSAIIETAQNLAFQIREAVPDQISSIMMKTLIEELNIAAGYLKQNLIHLRSDKSLVLTLMVLSRHIDISVRNLLTPLTKTPNFDQASLVSAFQSFNKLKDEIPEFYKIDLISCNTDAQEEVSTENIKYNTENEDKDTVEDYQLNREERIKSNIDPIRSYEIGKWQPTQIAEVILRSIYQEYIMIFRYDIRDNFDVILRDYVEKRILSRAEILYQSAPLPKSPIYVDTIRFYSTHRFDNFKIKLELGFMKENQSNNNDQEITRTTLTLGMPGEVLRFLLQTTVDPDPMILLTEPISSIPSTLRRVRDQKYRLPDMRKILRSAELVQVDRNFEELEYIINNHPDQEIFIFDVRPLILSNLHSPLLINDLQGALKAETKKLITKSGQNVLRNELREFLVDYRKRFEEARMKLDLQSLDNTGKQMVIMQHHPQVPPQYKKLLHRWIDNPSIITGGSLSKGIVTSPHGITYHSQWTSDDEKEADKLLLNMSSVSIVGADPNDLNKSIRFGNSVEWDD